MELYLDQFSDAHDFHYEGEPSRFLVIASTPRSGSHMLGHALFNTRAFGFPLEYLNPANLREWKRRLNVERTCEAIQSIISRRTSLNGVFAIKMHYSHLAALADAGGIEESFPRAVFVHLTRNDILSQAVSLSVAFQTGEWIAGQTTTSKDAIYNFGHIDSCMKSIIADNAGWNYYFATRKFKCCHLAFEDVRTNLEGSIRAIADFVGVDMETLPIDGLEATSRQGNTRNSEWRQRFLEDFDGRDFTIPIDQPKLSLSACR